VFALLRPTGIDALPLRPTGVDALPRSVFRQIGDIARGFDQDMSIYISLYTSAYVDSASRPAEPDSYPPYYTPPMLTPYPPPVLLQIGDIARGFDQEMSIYISLYTRLAASHRY